MRTRGWGPLGLLLLAAALASVGGPARADERGGHAGHRAAPRAGGAAEALFHRGMEHQRAGEYDLAVSDFTEGYRLSGEPNYLYLIGAAQREAGHVPEAIAAYKRYLEASPAAPDRQLVLDQLDELAQQPGAPPAAVGPPAPARTPAGAARAAAPVPSQLPPAPDLAAWARGPAEPPTPLWRRPWLWVGVGLAVVAGVAIGVGVALRPTERTFSVAPGGKQ